MRVALAVHLLGAVFWVGGMAFAHFALRPAAAALAPPERLRLLQGIFTRFIPQVGVAVLAILLTGGWMVMSLGGFARVAPSIHAMTGLGAVMMAIYAYIFVVPYRELRRAVAIESWTSAGAAVQKIRKLVLVNLVLGIIVIGIATLPFP